MNRALQYSGTYGTENAVGSVRTRCLSGRTIKGKGKDMAEKALTESYQYRFTVNGHQDRWRCRVSRWLRKMASRLDGRLTPVIEVATTPDIGLEAKAECIRKGLDHAERLIAEAARAAAIERLMPRTHPRLYRRENAALGPRKGPSHG